MLATVLKRLVAPVFVAVVSLGLAACGGKGDCDKAVDHMIALTKADLPEDRAAQAATDRDKLVAKCKEEGLSKKQEECILSAKKLAELTACDKK